MHVERTRRDLRRRLDAARAAGQRIALVPTMGFLHEGHLSLVDLAKQHGDVVVMSIFVNPLQFGPREDLATYPRDFDRDCALAEARGVHVLFAPDATEMYEDGAPQVTVVASDLATKLEGRFRPGHFEGVLTVVAKLFNIVQPDAAVFGQKDFQQCVLIERMRRDLDFDCDVVIGDTVREPDGLALSSRNVYLSQEDRSSAVALSRALHAAQDAFAAGESDPHALVDVAKAVLARDANIQVQYVELVDARTLVTPERASGDCVISLAALVGTTRLIDNTRIGG